MSYLDPSLIHSAHGAVYGSTVAPQQYQPFAVASHLPPHVYSSASPEDFPIGGQGQQHPSSGKVKGKGAYKESPVKAACLTCRAKKAKCDGVKPICGAVSHPRIASSGHCSSPVLEKVARVPVRQVQTRRGEEEARGARAICVARVPEEAGWTAGHPRFRRRQGRARADGQHDRHSPRVHFPRRDVSRDC